MILAGDIGGTKTHLAIFDVAAGALRQRRASTFRSGDFQSLDAVIAAFAGPDLGEVQAACFGIAGPVDANRTRTTNLAWEEVDGALVAARTGIPDVTLINDLAATAEGIDALGPDDLLVLRAGRPDPAAPRAVIAAGTGLGMAIALPGGHVIASEGGHVDFAPRDEAEIELLRALRRVHGRVSLERVVSGPGLTAIYEHLRDRGVAPGNPAIDGRSPDQDASALVSAAARDAGCALSAAAVNMLMSAYGAAAGNLALTCLARGGVYIGGGVAPRNLDALRSGPFIESFLAKGRYRALMSELPLTVILNQHTALLGSAVHARRRLGI